MPFSLSCVAFVNPDCADVQEIARMRMARIIPACFLVSASAMSLSVFALIIAMAGSAISMYRKNFWLMPNDKSMSVIANQQMRKYCSFLFFGFLVSIDRTMPSVKRGPR